MRFASVRNSQTSNGPMPSNANCPSIFMRVASVHTEGFTVSRTAGGKTLFRVPADTNIGLKNNMGVLEDVDVIIYPATANEQPKTIRGKKCTYDQGANDFQFDGDVAVY